MPLLTLAQAKAQLDIDTTAHDGELQDYIDALTAVIEARVGPIEIRTVTETVDSRDMRLALTQTPAVALTSLTPVVTGGLALDVADLVLDGQTGIVRRRIGARFYGGPWTAVYTAGRASTLPTVGLAARLLLQHLWRTQYGGARGRGSADDYDVTEPIPGFGYAVPNRVLELLEPFKPPPGMA
ncbi:head-tail connector protein [Streptomyces jumonjinensis]|uniref:Phage gp6-like head-tail connector protein n=1 Tax=Streptomyces jumonjinensis TaxID=1945 RepID=A0A646KLH7_STRJU|nr:phage gp6-like head-tail connector protein [Streptomyces jumonjinensis]MQT03174.1 hypothetical protein [Streptomyces jumonjinensis]